MTNDEIRMTKECPKSECLVSTLQRARRSILKDGHPTAILGHFGIEAFFSHSDLGISHFSARLIHRWTRNKT
jgi:hypothetical protein